MKNIFARWIFTAMALLLLAHPALGETAGTLQPKDMREIMMMTRQEILLTFGDNYEQRAAGEDGTWQGYYYPALGYTFAFEAKAEDDTPVRWIGVDDGISFDGFFGGMNWTQVEQRVGKEQVTEGKGNPSLGEDPALEQRSYTYDCLAGTSPTAVPCYTKVYSEWGSDGSASEKTHLMLISASIYMPGQFYNPDGGLYYHTNEYCPAVSSTFLPLKAVTCWNESVMENLRPCPNCVGLESWPVSTRYYTGTDGSGTRVLVEKVYDRFTKVIVHTPQGSSAQQWTFYIGSEHKAVAQKVAEGLYTGWFYGNAVTEPAVLVPSDAQGNDDTGRAVSLQKGK